MPKHELNKDDTNRHAKVGVGKTTRPQSYKKNLWATKSTEGVRSSLTHERAYQLFLQYQMVSHESINTHGITQTKQAIFNKIYV